ncbi:hypothetical protein AVEN_88245-1 [Araneus ventricosus]|uniref:Uncharacterized protein n=1 Tax=Araneus ventricosus TaxID=182803 RepID=A0A4Y2IQC1_ARAVE|nr:hypothetical protein AVEN_88245-1 [Araneus ventricosus]
MILSDFLRFVYQGRVCKSDFLRLVYQGRVCKSDFLRLVYQGRICKSDFLRLVYRVGFVNMPAGGFQVRNTIPLMICRVLGLLHVKSYVRGQVSSLWCDAEVWRASSRHLTVVQN